MERFEAGRFVLATLDNEYITSFDTWEESAVAWEDNGFLPAGVKLEDQETGRVWSHGARYEWEAAAT